MLISGATSGIGLELARHYHHEGWRLVLLGRRDRDELDPELFTPARYCRVDLARATAARTVVDFLDEHGVDKLHTVVHNAGVGYYGPVAQQPDDSVRDLLQVNLYAPVALTHALLPRLAEMQGRRPTVALVSSVAADVPVPDYAVYGASKAGLDGFARSLRAEVSPDVNVTLVHPGATRTALHQKSGVPEGRLDTARFADAADVARDIVRAIENERAEVTVGVANRGARALSRHLPTPLDTLLRRRQTSASAAPRTTPPRNLPRRCVVTGAASGIGAALASHYHGLGYDVVGIDLDAPAPFITPLQADLSDLDDLERVARTLAAGPSIDLLVHSAGISAVGRFSQSDLAAQQQVLAVNLDAPILLTNRLLREGAFSADSTLVFISSLSHFTSYPGAAVYAASKDGLAAYARTLSVALAPHGIHVLRVFPGPTRTPHARRYSPDNSREARRMPPDQLARLVARALARRRYSLVPGTANKLAALLGRWLPHTSERLMRRLILDKLEES
ncbi:MAG: SDR family NAD(P)-dependent oxidoreductase [Trueperaceae bacterium]|nr:SDR family NAD(P)-dependent oxidoreductase [Trueperaceae bacterium]